jgi:phage virion morphogenesis protein
MAGAGITIAIDDKPVAEALARVIAAGRDLQPLFERIGAQMVQNTSMRFEAESGPGGRKWQKLAKSTLASKAPDTRILRRRGFLSHSLTFNTLTDSVEWGSGVKYAAIHQLGGTIEHPARQGSAMFRRAKEGAFTKADGSRVGSRWRFARKRSKAKRNIRQDFEVPAYTITIPARPYLGIDEADSQEIVAIAEAYLAEASGEGA